MQVQKRRSLGWAGAQKTNFAFAMQCSFNAHYMVQHVNIPLLNECQQETKKIGRVMGLGMGKTSSGALSKSSSGKQ